MLKPGVRNLAVFLMLLYLFLMRTGYTDADIFAERIVSHNKFSALKLDFSARNSFNSSPVNSLFHSLGIQAGGFDLGAIKIQPDTETKFRYRLKAVPTNGDGNFCSRLRLKVFNRNFSEIFNGSLLNLSLSDLRSDPKDFIFFVSLDDPDAALKNKICEFNFDFKSYRDNPEESGGIFAQRLVSNVVSSGN